MGSNVQMSKRFRRWTVVALLVVAAVVMSARGVLAQSTHLDVNDLAFLWPPPQTPDQVNGLLSANAPLGSASVTAWPQNAFDVLRTTAASTQVMSPSGLAFGIDFTPYAPQFAQLSTWKVVGIRIDPSATGSDPSAVSRFGTRPQIRLVLQPVTVAGTKVRVHDVAAHLAYSFITGMNGEASIPNRELFRAIVADLVSLKAAARQRGIETAGPLGVHPAFARDAADFQGRIAAFLGKWLPQGRLTEMAFIGIDPPEPWIFLAMAGPGNGSFVSAPLPNAGGATAQMLTFRGGDPVVPVIQTRNLDASAGVSTEPLFRDEFAESLNSPAVPGVSRPSLADVPDIIANPRMATVRNTDCVSCHSESTRRSLLDINTDSRFAYARAAGISGVDPSVLPKTAWNLRNFGWFQDRAGLMSPTVSLRAANEVADAVAVVNAEYLGVATTSPAPAAPQPERTVMSPAPVPVASPLTLVMTTKSPEDTAALKALVTKIQGLPQEQNPIWQALTKLGTVHFARFVFLNDRQLAVITTYDGSFEDYIDAFVNTIGGVFDQLLAHMADAPPLPVSDHRDEFLAYVRRNDLTAMPPFYSAYPRLKVMDILTLDKQRAK